MKAKQKSGEPIVFRSLERDTLAVCVIGTTPLIMNSVSTKVKQVLILPQGRKTPAEKNNRLKHNPVAEFVDSIYMNPGENAPTRCMLPPIMFKAAICKAALEVEGAVKAQIERVTWVRGTRQNDVTNFADPREWVSSIDVYGIPRLYTTGVRMADAKRTLDMRTRAMITDWCCVVPVQFVKNTLNPTSVAALVSAAGIVSGVGDFRHEKGKGDFGSFDICEPDDERFQYLVNNCGREAQDKAIRNPQAADLGTSSLLEWFMSEVKRRGKEELLVTPNYAGQAAAM